jgi:diguanylate cyclase
MNNKYYKCAEEKLRAKYNLDLYEDIFLMQKDLIISFIDTSNLNYLNLEIICGNLELIAFDDQPSILLSTILDAFDYNNTYGKVAGREKYYQQIYNQIYNFSKIRDVSFPIIHNGIRKWIRFNLFPSIKHSHIEIVYITDVTKLHTQEEETFGKSHIDSLTNLFNRYTFDYDYGQIYLLPGFHVMFMDIDNFKVFNDKHGHHTGNYVLQTFAKILENISNNRTRFYRLGGDEFVGLIIGSTDEVKYMANQIIEQTRMIEINQGNAQITVSIGVMKANKSQDLARKADQLMYKAKSMGKNQFIYEIEE